MTHEAEQIRPYMGYLYVYRDENDLIKTMVHKFYLDEQELWEEQINTISKREYNKKIFWNQVEKYQNEIDQYNEKTKNK